MPTPDQKIAEVLSKYGEPMAGNIWRVQGTAVIYHKALERIAAQAKIRFDEPHIIRAERDEAVMRVTGHMDNRTEWSIGEALVNVNYRVSGKQAAYVWAMAEKRAKDRVILKLIELEGYVLSEDDAIAKREEDSGEPERPVPPEVPDSSKFMNSPQTDVNTPHTTNRPGSIGSSPDQPSKGEEPPHMEPFEFDKIIEEVKDHLSTTRTDQDILDVLAMFNDDYNRMSPQQRAVVDAEGLSATERVRRREAEEGRQRVESGGGKGIRGYMDEDRADERNAAEVTKAALYDPALINAMELTPDGDEKIRLRVLLACEQTLTADDADQLYSLMKLTQQRRKQIADANLQVVISERAKQTLKRFEG